MPISAQAFFLDRTYVAESRRSPTRITAKPGVTPYVAFISSTLAFNSSRIVAEMAVPAAQNNARIQ
jgi:hypothetical protein